VNEPTSLVHSDPCAASFDADRSSAPDTLRLALNINRDIENGEMWESFLGLLAGALRLVAADRPVEVHGLPMQCRFKEHTDLDELDGLFASLTAVDGLRTIRHVPQDHRDVAAVIEACDVVISERLHAIVMAAALGRAVVGLPYDVKVHELVDQLALVDRSFDVNEPFAPEALAAAVLSTADASVAEGRRLSALADERRSEATVYFDEVRSWLRDPDRRGWPSATGD
jgi:polysaccharide pyruvyl transferase WcaK-like protein